MCFLEQFAISHIKEVELFFSSKWGEKKKEKRKCKSELNEKLLRKNVVCSNTDEIK